MGCFSFAGFGAGGEVGWFGFVCGFLFVLLNYPGCGAVEDRIPMAETEGEQGPLRRFGEEGVG